MRNICEVVFKFVPLNLIFLNVNTKQCIEQNKRPCIIDIYTTAKHHQLAKWCPNPMSDGEVTLTIDCGRHAGATPHHAAINEHGSAAAVWPMMGFHWVCGLLTNGIF